MSPYFSSNNNTVQLVDETGNENAVSSMGCSGDGNYQQAGNG